MATSTSKKADDDSLPKQPGDQETAAITDPQEQAGAQSAKAGELIDTANQTIAAAARGELAQAAAAAPDLPAELNNIDFRVMIGGPLQAAVDAQVASSIASMKFINDVGFTAPDSSGKRELVMVDFTHDRTELDKDGNEVKKEIKLKVPFLAMVQIPSLRIEHVIIDFNAKLNSIQRQDVSDKLGIDAEVGGSFGPVNFKVTASYQRKSSSGLEVKKEYSLSVQVKAVQDEIPAGLEKVLALLAA
jgi:hypothetical protein